jgi:hypothetical protein
MKKNFSFALALPLLLMGNIASADHFGRRLLDLVDRGIRRSHRIDNHSRINYGVICRQGDGRIILDYGGFYFDGYNYDMVNLTRDIEYYCRIPVENLTMYSLILVAKSRVGLGYAAIEAGYFQTSYERVHGNPLDFPGEYGYSRLFFRMPPMETRGPWILKFRGEIKLHSVIMAVNTSVGAPGNY